MTTPPLPWEPDLHDRSTSVDRVNTVAFTPMPVRLRNELITQSYGDIAEAMGELLGTDNATWSNLGVWASSSIGKFLTLPIPVIGSAMSRPFADGNRDVFADVGRAHVDFLDTVGHAYHNGDPIRPAWSDCRQRLRGHRVETPGNAAGDNFALWASLTNSPARPVGKRPSNRLLVHGFAAYTRALRLAGDDKATAILLGNVLLALHEQRLLSMAISVGFRSWLRTITSFPRPMQSQHEWATTVPGRGHVWLENRWIGLSTRFLVGIEIPGDSVRVSKPVPSGTTPVLFDRIDVAVATGLERGMTDAEKLSQIYSALEVDGQSVSCWNDQIQRMRYITSLFEQQQRSDRWFDGQGAVIRPKPWSGFDRSLTSHAKVMQAAPDAYVASECPLDDNYLDSLRLEASHPELSGAALLTFDAIRDKTQRRQLMGEIHADSADRLAAISGPRGLLSPTVCAQSRELYDQWSVMMLMGLLFRSLPHDYAAARGVKVLGQISSLGTDSLRRAGETAHFVRDLMQSSAGWSDSVLIPDGEAMESVVGVRCLHSIVSGHLIEAGWDTPSLGVPVNQEDVLGTALSFAVPPLEMMMSLGVKVKTELLDAYTSFWCGIGHLLGAPLEAVTVATHDGGRRALTFAEGQAVTAAIRRRHHSRSLDGVRLTEALMVGVGDGFPRGFGWLSHGMMRALGDPTVTSILLSHVGPGRTRAGAVATFLRTGLRFRPSRSATRWMVEAIGNRWLEPFMTAGERRPYRHPARHMARPARTASTDTSVWPFGC